MQGCGTPRSSAELQRAKNAFCRFMDGQRFIPMSNSRYPSRFQDCTPKFALSDLIDSTIKNRMSLAPANPKRPPSMASILHAFDVDLDQNRPGQAPTSLEGEASGGITAALSAE